MRVIIDGGELLLVPGGWRGESRVPLQGLDAWDLFYEVMGRRFLAFHVGERTFYVNLPRLAPSARQSLLAELTQIVGFGPSAELLSLERDNSHWLAVWEIIKQIGRYLRLFINPRAPLR